MSTSTENNCKETITKNIDPVTLDIKGESGPLTPLQRRDEAFKIRENEAISQRRRPLEGQLANGDEYLYCNKIASFTKTLSHNSLGEVNLNSYDLYLKALITGNPDYFKDIPLGGPTKLVNPQAAYAYDLTGGDSHSFSIPKAPNFSSAWIASEMAEDYWMALTRDVPFSEYDSNYLTLGAASDLSNFSDFRGPKKDGLVTSKTLFRDDLPGTLVGPYVSQFLLKDIPLGPKNITQQYLFAAESIDYVTKYDEWLNIQNGAAPTNSIKYDTAPRYIYNSRALASFVYKDFPYQCILNAALILLQYGNGALSTSNPYINYKNQSGFITFGQVHILDFVAKAARCALEAAWFQKFLVHCRLRPEAFAGCIHNNLTGATNYPINDEILNSKAIGRILSKFGTYLLPIAYPEGSPAHPAYPSGHATIVGAGVTILKAFFNEAFILPDPVISNSNGLSLLPYKNEPLTLGNELNKLASNISLGRDFAGVHWRSDGSEGLKLGEAVAIQILQDYRETYNEKFSGFTFTKFDGHTILI